MFSTIQRPSLTFTWITLSLLPSPMSTNGSSSAPMWTAVGAFSVSVMWPVQHTRCQDVWGARQSLHEAALRPGCDLPLHGDAEAVRPRLQPVDLRETGRSELRPLHRVARPDRRAAPHAGADATEAPGRPAAARPPVLDRRRRLRSRLPPPPTPPPP